LGGIFEIKVMKIKTIKNVISSKFDDFLTSITDEEVKKLVKKNTLISGGCIATMLLKEQVNDYDLYFTNKETVLAVCNYYANQFESTGTTTKVVDVDNLNEEDKHYFSQRGFTQPGRVGLFCAHQDYEEKSEEDIIEKIEEIKKEEKEKYKIQYISPNAVSLSGKIQLILRFYGTPEEIHSNYDFVHCTNYWLSSDENLHLNQKALESILTKELTYIGSKYPVASMIRTRKFINRGWTCNAGTFLKIAFQISKLNLEDIPTLEDQLVGVDVGYFIAFVSAMKAAQKAHADEGKVFVITYPYICEIIDRIFND
jgi:hypothetical protein